MDTPQAAASLFGSDDPSSDPFAVIGAESAAPDPFQENPSASEPLSQDVGFDAQPNYGEHVSYPNYGEQPAPWDAPAPDAAHGAHSYPAYENANSTAPQYESKESYNNGYGGVPTSYPQQPASYYTPSQYNPPAPQTANTWQAEPPATDRYTPAAPSNASQYDPYSHYSQPTTSQYQSYGQPVYSVPHTVAPHTQPTIPAPEPPKVSKPPERPKVLNAYDPPFPTTKSRRPTRPTPVQSYGGYGYQAPAVAPVAPLAPPPRATPPPPPLPQARATPPPARPTPPPVRPTPPPARATPPPRAPGYTNANTAPTNTYDHKPNYRAYSPAQGARPPSVNPYQTLYVPTQSTHALAQTPIHQDFLEPAPAEESSITAQAAHWSPEQTHTTPSSPPPNPYNYTHGPQASHPEAQEEAVNEEVHHDDFPDELTTHNHSHKPLSPGVATTQAPYDPPTVGRDIHQPPKSSSPELTRSPPHTSPRIGAAYPPDPYAPPQPSIADVLTTKRTQSPKPQSYAKPDAPPSRQVYSPPPPRQVYSPPPPRKETIQRDRSFTNGSVTGTYAPTVPVPLPQPTLFQSYDPPQMPASESTSSFGGYNPSQEQGSPVVQTLHAPTSTVYAPSPSLLGSNDPLARTTARAPVINFGFGGRLVTCFHGAATLNTGYDVALSSRNTTAVQIQVLNKLLPKSVLENSEVEFAGPLVPDSGSASIALVRAAATTQAKGKKARVSKYLEDRAAEIGQGLAYLNPQERQSSEAKLALIKLLKVMVDNDGQLLGLPQAESSVRAALVPDVSGTTDTQASIETTSPVLYPIGFVTESSDSPISVTTLTSTHLKKIEDLLKRGERKQAYTYALDQKLWAHAMVIASSIDKEAWKEAVNDFIHTELASNEPPHSAAMLPGTRSANPSSGHDSLRAAYSLFSGQGSAAVQELVPTKLLSLASGLQPPNLLGPSTTPRTPAFPPAAFSVPSPPASLSQWKETVAMIISSPLSADASSALTALGDQLLSYGWVEAAHACYLLSPQTSPLGGVGSPASRITLLGCKAPQLYPQLSKDSDAFIFSEILEFALSLAPVAKGQEPFNGISHLQIYRLVRATHLAEMGDIQLANRYCEAISSCISKPSPYFNPTFVHQLRILTERINGVVHSEKSGSWIGGKISKPSLDTIGGWLEGRFTKLVTGEGDGEAQEEEKKKESNRTFDGPFAQYSNISNAPSARSSPQPTAPQNQIQNHLYAPPQRTSSAMAISSTYHSAQPIDRASSAMDYMRDPRQHQQQHQQPGAPSLGAPPFGSYGNYSVNQNGPALGLNTASQPHAGGDNHYRTFSTDSNNKPSPDGQELETPIQQQGSSWWDYSSGNSQTPTAATFMKVDEPIAVPDSATNGGFISLMDTQQFGFQPKVAPAPSEQYRQRHDYGDEEEEDLGFGNSKKNSRISSPTEETRVEPAKQAAPPPAPSKPEASSSSGQTLGNQTQASGGWLSKWWKRSDSTENGSGGPIKAKLGEENSFYYDKEQKRWVNKKAGAEEAKPAPPPPPPRAATASPSKTSAFRPIPPHNNSAPPRATSAMDFSSPAENSGPRVRSNLVPMEAGGGTPPPAMAGSRPPSAAPPPPMGGSRPPSTAPPPPMGGSRPPSAAPSLNAGPPPVSRPGSAAVRKKNIRSRYVDVFQQPEAS